MKVQEQIDKERKALDVMVWPLWFYRAQIATKNKSYNKTDYGFDREGCRRRR